MASMGSAAEGTSIYFALMQAARNGTVIAESDDTVVVEGILPR